MKVIIAPDKFKGSLSSFKVCDAIEAGIKSADASIEIIKLPMADGGDGFAAVMKFYINTETKECISQDPLGRRIECKYEWDSVSNTAIVELATASGLTLLQDKEKNALKTSTYGTGLIVKDAISRGAKKIKLGLGGSATNDGGIGILAALGFSFGDKDGNPLKPSGGSLLVIDKIALPSKLPDVSFEIACDVENVLCGEYGAAYVFGPQKGASATEVLLLDAGLAHFAEVIRLATEKEIANIPGTGAAGGVAAGLIPFFETTLKSGIDMVIDASNIRNKVLGTDLIITGEGKIDQQTLHGKVVCKLAALAHQHKIPAIAICGLSEISNDSIHKLNLKSVISLVSETIGVNDAISNAKELLSQRIETYFADQ